MPFVSSGHPREARSVNLHPHPNWNWLTQSRKQSAFARIINQEFMRNIPPQQYFLIGVHTNLVERQGSAKLGASAPRQAAAARVALLF
jgi:hypothetical protein